METAVKEELQNIPGFSRGVLENAAVRMLKMGRPICPQSKVIMELGEDGNYRPKDMGPEYINCQLGTGEWWLECEKRGHNPYWRVHTWTTKEPIVEEDDQGRFIQTGEQLFYHESKQPNIVQVAISVRINSGKGAINAVKKKGFRRLTDIGYFEVCQFRNCQKPVSRNAKSKTYGSFCSVRHLELIAADAEGVLLHIPNQTINGQYHSQVKKDREKQLREAAVGAFDRE